MPGQLVHDALHGPLSGKGPLGTSKLCLDVTHYSHISDSRCSLCASTEASAEHAYKRKCPYPCCPMMWCATTACVFLPLWPAGFAAAESSAVAEAIKDAFCCKCATGPATAQALADSIAVAGGCGKIGEALAREWRGDSMLLWFWCITRSHGRLLAIVPRRPMYAPGGRCSLRA